MVQNSNSEATSVLPVDIIEAASPPPPPSVPPSQQRATVSVKYDAPLSAIPGARQAPVNGHGEVYHRRGSSGVQYLNELSNNPNAVLYRIEAKRIGPAMYEGQMLPQGTVDTFSPIPYEAAQERLRVLCGGGDYKLIVHDDHGTVVNQLNVRIDMNQEPPKIHGQFLGASTGAPQRYPFNARQAQPPANAAVFQDVMSEEASLQQIKAEERKLAAINAKEETEYQVERKRKQRKLEEDREFEARESRTNAPMAALQTQMQQQMSSFEKTIMMMQQQAQATAQAAAQAQAQSQQQMMQMFQAMVTTMSAKKEDNTMPLMMESMKQQTQIFMTMMTTMTAQSQSKQNELLEAAKVQADANKAVMEMAYKSAQGGNTRYDKIIEALVVQGMNRPQDSMKQALDLMDRGRRDTLEMLELRDKFGPDSNSPWEWNPEEGAGGNIARMVFEGLKQVPQGGGGAAALSGLLGAINRPSPEHVQPSDLRALSTQMTQRYGVQAPGMVQNHQFPQPQQVAPGLPAFDPVSRGVPNVPLQARPMPVQQVRAPIVTPQHQPVLPAQPQANPAVEESFEEEELSVQDVPAEVAQPVAEEVVASTAEESPEERLRARLNDVLEMAIEDAKDNIREPEWPEYAVNKVNQDFLDQLVKAKDDAARVQLIKENSDEAVFNRLYAELMQDTTGAKYTNFIRGLNMLVSEHAQERGIVVGSGL